MALALSTIKLVKNNGALQIVNAHAAISHAGDQPVILDLAADKNRRSRAGVFHSVFQKMLQHFFDPHHIHDYRR